MDKTNLQIIRESFGKVAYSHKTHEKAAEIEEGKKKKIKWGNIFLTTFTSGTLVGRIVTNEAALLYIGAALATLALAFTIFQLSFNPAERAAKHKSTAQKLWYIREKYVHLMADIINDRLSEDLIVAERNQLIEELKLIYEFAPGTDSKSYQEARKALKINEELTFSNEEIDQFLPDSLRIEKD
ncbi:MAG: SLATT domain-containing protein [Patescibacteria group bacterium]|nr:SLATT domain-containing protein [Patescibacteria group bacterium]